ncbi:MAG: photosystem II assembly protein Psb34, partial [Prochlorotrichaceae cyanobacterium]
VHIARNIIVSHEPAKCRFMQAPAFNGATVDQEGLTNNYGIEPAMYFATMPSVDQARNYLYQGLAATALVVTLIVTSVLAS